jgi:hypothetical protein
MSATLAARGRTRRQRKYRIVIASQYNNAADSLPPSEGLSPTFPRQSRRKDPRLQIITGEIGNNPLSKDAS